MERFDVVVAGAGFAGTAAAIAAAECGARVLVADRSNSPGGAAANCLVNPFMGWKTEIEGRQISLCRGIFERILARLDAFSARSGGIFSEEYLKYILGEMLLEAGATPLYRVDLVSAQLSDGRIESVGFAGKQGLIEIAGGVFVDATGDADLTALAGLSTRLGRESDGLCQPMTLCFRVGNVDTEAFFAHKKELDGLYSRFQSEGKIKNPRENILVFRTLSPGVLHFNTTRVVRRNPVDAFELTAAEIEARRQVFEIFDFMKENAAGFAGAVLLSTAPEIGVRESRMIDGKYLLTGDDLRACRKFDDSIALGNYDIDIHNPEGSGTSHYYFAPGEYYTIPFRSLEARDCRNLLAAGRCISVDHEAQASVRIMPIVCCTGEAAGVAAAMSGGELSSVDAGALRERLAQRGAAV